MDAILQWVSQYGYIGLFGALVLGIAGLPIPDETILLFCGYLIAAGRMNAVLTFTAGALGSVCGITLSYVIGRTLGKQAVLRFGARLHVTEANLAQVNAWFLRLGHWLLTVGYFILGVRHFTALAAGMAGLRYRVFALYAYTGALLWVATFLTIGYFVGDQWRNALVLAHRYSGIATGLVACAALGFWLVRRRLQ